MRFFRHAILIAGAAFLAACASKSTDLASENVGASYKSIVVAEELAAARLPKIAVVHIPVGVERDAQELFASRFRAFLDYKVVPEQTHGAPSAADIELRRNHQSFIDSNAINAIMKSGLILGDMVASDDRFAVAHYIVEARDGRLVRAYLDDPGAFPPSLAHVELQFLTEPRDPLLFTGMGADVLTLGRVGAPIFAVAYDPAFRRLGSTSNELNGATLLDRLNGTARQNVDGLSTEVVSIAAGDWADTRDYVVGTIIEAINDSIEPDRVVDAGRDWYAWYGLSDGSAPVAGKIAEAESFFIAARGKALRTALRGSIGKALDDLMTAEAKTYDKRREVAAEQTRTEVQTALGVASMLLGGAAMGVSGSTNPGLTQRAGILMQQSAAQLGADQIELEALERQSVEVAAAYESFYVGSFLTNAAFRTAVETEFGEFDLTDDLAAAKAKMRSKL